jgi:hypothetical protein
MRMHMLAILTLPVILSACQAVGSSGAPVADDAAAYALLSGAPPAGDARLYVFDGRTDSGLRLRTLDTVILDGYPAGKVGSGEILAIDVPAGKHVVSASVDGVGISNSLPLNLDAGDKDYVAVGKFLTHPLFSYVQDHLVITESQTPPDYFGDYHALANAQAGAK